MPCTATQDGWVMVESSNKTWSTGEENGKPLQYSCLKNPMNSMKKQKDKTLDQWRNNSRKIEEMEPKQKQHPVVDVTGDVRKVRCYKEKCCIGTWNVSSMIQGKLEAVKQEMARVNVDILNMEWVNLTQMALYILLWARIP